MSPGVLRRLEHAAVERGARSRVRPPGNGTTRQVGHSAAERPWAESQPHSRGDHGAVRSLQLFRLVFLLVWCLGSAAAVSASESVTAIPVPDIATRAAEVTTFLATWESLATPGPDLQAIQQDLPTANQQLQENWEHLSQQLASDPSAPMLDRLGFIWQRMHDQFREWAERLKHQGTSLQQEDQQLADLQAIWTRSLQEVQRAQSPPEVVTQATGTLNALRGARTRVNARLSSLLMVEYQVGLGLRRAEQALARIATARTELLARLPVRTAAPLWHGALWARASSESRAALQSVWTTAGAGLAADATLQAGRMACQGLGCLLLYLLLRQIRRWLGPQRQIDPFFVLPNRLLERPGSTALTVALLVTPWVYPSYSVTLAAAARLLVVVPALRLVALLLPPRALRGLYVFGIVLAIEPFRPLLTATPDVEHALFLIDLGVAACLVNWMWFVTRQERVRLGSRPCGPPRRALVPLLGGTYAFAFLAGGGGYLQLARLLATAAVRGAYAWVLVDMLTCLGEVLLVGLLRLGPGRRLEAVRRFQPTLERRAAHLLNWAGFVAWLLMALSAFTIATGPVQVGRAMLAAGIGYGVWRVTLGDLALFAGTLWSAFAVSTLVRAVLEADVFPRVRLGEGVPVALANLAHYAIVVIGFALALPLLGVDLTKITILVGAFGVGVGFGLQTIINNFISGLILLFERPVRVGDVIQVGETQGQVARLGARAAVISTGQGAEVFVPNAQLVADKVTNWTHGDRTLRIDLKVTAAPGSDPEQVRNLVRAAATGDPDILRVPPPTIFSLGLGDGGVRFELRVWTRGIERADAIRSTLIESLSGALGQSQISHSVGGG